MANRKYFGTDGVRGVANLHPMTAELVLEIGRAVAFAFKQLNPDKRHKILIGKDTRRSGYMLENALTAGICSMGVDVLLTGPMPTPGIAFNTHSMRADAGLVISASHNPYMDNGIKIFSGDGYKLPDEMEARIESLIGSEELAEQRPIRYEIGRAKRIDDAMGRYIVFCKNTFPDRLALDGLRIAMDCANGATYKVAPIVFQELGADIVPIHNQPDGRNINENCGSEHTADLRHKVLETRADLGIAFDGDGDRLIAIDEQGHQLTGDHIIAICARHAKEQNALRNNRVVTTVMSNFGLTQALKKLQIEHEVSAVGDRYVLEKMVEADTGIGGEASGHMIFREHHTTGDGIIAALQLLAALQDARGTPLSELARVLTLSPQKLINCDVADKPPLDSLPQVREAVAKAEAELNEKGRVLIRYSGTQNMCRVMVEGPNVEITERICDELAEVIKSSIG